MYSGASSRFAKLRGDTKNEQKTRNKDKSTQRAHTSAKANSIQMRSPDMDMDSAVRTPDLDYFQNVTGTSLSKDTSMLKFFEKIGSVLLDI